MTLSPRLKKAFAPLGLPGLSGLVLIAGALWMDATWLKPMESTRNALEQRIAQAARGDRAGAALTRASTAPEKLAAFHAFFDRDETTTDWLARLYSISAAIGLEFLQAEYRPEKAGERLVRYQITLPVRGTTGQVRAFVENALVQIPVLSLDKVTFRRQRTTDALAEAEVVFSLYLNRL